MTARTLLAFTVALLLPAGTFLAFSLLNHEHRISQRHCWQIRPGMSEQDVAAIFGGPAGDRTSRPVLFIWLRPSGEFTRTKAWLDDGGGILVAFDLSGTVVSAEFQEPKRLERSFVTKACRRLGRTGVLPGF